MLSAVVGAAGTRPGQRAGADQSQKGVAGVSRPVLTAPNQGWAVDFASDVAASGRRLRIFSMVDCYTRECLALEVDPSLPSRPVTCNCQQERLVIRKSLCKNLHLMVWVLLQFFDANAGTGGL
jgi:hypothetical protein